MEWCTVGRRRLSRVSIRWANRHEVYARKGGAQRLSEERTMQQMAMMAAPMKTPFRLRCGGDESGVGPLNPLYADFGVL